MSCWGADLKADQPGRRGGGPAAHLGARPTSPKGGRAGPATNDSDATHRTNPAKQNSPATIAPGPRTAGGGSLNFQVSDAGCCNRQARDDKNAEAYNPKIAADLGLTSFWIEEDLHEQSNRISTVCIAFVCFFPLARPGGCRYPADTAAVTSAVTAVTSTRCGQNRAVVSVTRTRPLSAPRPP